VYLRFLDRSLTLQEPFMINNIDVREFRDVDHDIESIFPERWSPRAMSGEALDPACLMQLFEAARWAPSAFNAQPWRFIYALQGTPHWDVQFDLLVDGNKSWCTRAGALIMVFSRRLLESNGKPMGTHAFDTGAAWQNLALQGARMGLVVHGMAGFDWGRASAAVNAPPEFSVQAMIAVGKPGAMDELSDSQREREQPSPRKTVAELSFEGSF
jgi:nitroreductase